jgi:PKD repeat protein/C1A family cysteine protease
MTGLPELTPQEREWQNQHQLRVKKVKLNRLGLQRINRYRAKQGRRQLTQSDLTVVPSGKEVVGAIGDRQSLASPMTSTASDVPAAGLPDSVDNSALKYFPPIRSQGSLNSCGAFSGTYYAMTYMYAMANDLDAKTGGTTCQLSPKWTYNMLNGGGNNGIWYYWAYDLGTKHGVASWAEFPYDSNYRAWSMDPAVWRAAIYRRFDQSGYVANTQTDSGIQQVKQMLVDGYVLNIPTYIYSWQYTVISNDPATNADDAYVGKKVCYWVNGTSGYHAMTVVGYNDNIWVDINNNGIVDPGEKGAFRIANSWGTGWGESGFVWMAYDALKSPSAVVGGPSTGRIYGWSPCRAHWVTARTAYQPTLLAEFTLNQANRNQLQVTLGVADPQQSVPSQTWMPDMIYADGGPYAFNGTTTACDGTFVFDFSDIGLQGGDLQRYFLGVRDTASGSPVTVKDFRLVDVAANNSEAISTSTPLTGDNQQLYASVDYSEGGTNSLPVAKAQVTALSGYAPLSVTFDANGSYDPDGTISSYSWNFGDGGTGTGLTASHTYISPGTYQATLTVTDDRGGTNEDWLTITVSPNPNNRLSVEAIDMSLQSSGQTREVKAVVSIGDLSDQPFADATVTGRWSGLVSGTVTGITGADGTVSFISPAIQGSGSVTFSVTQITAASYTYDESLNKETQDSITVTQTVNQIPVAHITADQTAGTAPLLVHFDGTGSSDPDGSIVSYQWTFGNGQTANGATASVTYDTPGTYEATLTVTDNSGATGTATLVITVNGNTSQSAIYISDLGMSIIPIRKWYRIMVTVEIRDTDGNPVPNASITGSWGGILRGKASGTTDANGLFTISSFNIKKSGTALFTVNTVVSPDGTPYEPDLNKETTVSMDVTP